MSVQVITAVSGILLKFADSRGVAQDESELKHFVEDLLFGERALQIAHEQGLVTKDEVVNAVLDRVLVRTFGISEIVQWGEEKPWEHAARELHAVLFGRS